MPLAKEALVYYDDILFSTPGDDFYFAFFNGTWGHGVDSINIYPTEVYTQRIQVDDKTIQWDAVQLRNQVVFYKTLTLPVTLSFNRLAVIKNCKPQTYWSGTVSLDTITLVDSHTFHPGDRILYNSSFHYIQQVNGQGLKFSSNIFPSSGTKVIQDASGIIMATSLNATNTLYSGTEFALTLTINGT